MPKKTELRKIIGNNIQEIRKQKGLSVQELAKLASISVSSLSNIEHGGVNFRLTTLMKIKTALKINLKDLFD